MKTDYDVSTINFATAFFLKGVSVYIKNKRIWYEMKIFITRNLSI